MRLKLFSALDWLAHLLYAPTMLGHRSGRTRWHHRIHLIPDRVLGWVCNRFDLWLGVTPDELNRRSPR